MGTFPDAKTFEDCLGGFFNLMADTPKIADKLLKSGMVIRFNYTDPDVSITADCSGDKMNILLNDAEIKPLVEMSMSADIAHKFWFGKVNLMAALTRKQMIAKGPIPKVLALLPAIKPSYKMYPEYLEANGYSDYNIY